MHLSLKTMMKGWLAFAELMVSAIIDGFDGVVVGGGVVRDAVELVIGSAVSSRWCCFWTFCWW